MADEQTGRHPFFLHRRHIRFNNAAFFTFFDEFGQLRIVLGSETGQIVFWRYGTERHALDRIGTGCENPEFTVTDQSAVVFMNVVLESETDAF